MAKDYLNADLTRKTIVFTGGTDGMGKIAVERLVQNGAKVVLLGRSRQKTQTVAQELNALRGSNNVQTVLCDLSSQRSIHQAAQSILELCPKIDVLVNCAGMNAGERIMTEDNMEATWAVNHLAPFLLTHLLMDRLKDSSPSRVVNLSSATEKSGHIHLDDIHLNKKWSTFKSYTQAKLAMNMCTRKWAQELEGTGVTVNALNPGFIKTNLLRSLKGWERLIGVPYMMFFASKPEVGAHRILRLALSDEYSQVSGKFVYEDAVRDPNPEALNDQLVEAVWKLSQEHISLASTSSQRT